MIFITMNRRKSKKYIISTEKDWILLLSILNSNEQYPRNICLETHVVDPKTTVRHLIIEIMNGKTERADELLICLSELTWLETKEINYELWHGKFDEHRKTKLLRFFQTLMQSQFFCGLLKSDITQPDLYTNLIETNVNRQFYGSHYILKQMVKTLNRRYCYMKENHKNDGREWFISTVAAPGSGKTFMCYHLLKLAMSGQLGSELREALGSKASKWTDLICALDKKIVGIQVNCNGNYRYHNRSIITSERDTCLRMLYVVITLNIVRPSIGKNIIELCAI